MSCLNNTKSKIAYFSLEILLNTNIPNYAGGLGVLAGDILRSASEKLIPMLGVSLIYWGDTYNQKINSDGTQTFYYHSWSKQDQLIRLPHKIILNVKGSDITVGCWRYDIVNLKGNFIIPVYLLDTQFPQNPQWAQDITKYLYSSNPEIRIMQEYLLGFGGKKMLEKLGENKVKNYILNEGHCAFVPLSLLPNYNYNDEEVKKRCLFITHTPVAAGHDYFNYDQVYQIVGEKNIPWHIKKIAGQDLFSTTFLAKSLSCKTLAVSKKHQQVTKHLLNSNDIDHVTNGICLKNWIHPYLQDFYTSKLGDWVSNPKLLQQAVKRIDSNSLYYYHLQAKKELISYVNQHLIAFVGEPNIPKEAYFNLETLTLSLARRPVAYKRPLLLYKDLERLANIGKNKLQIIQCGKSYPNDFVSQNIVKSVVDFAKKLKYSLRIVYLEDYSPKIAKMLVAGTDLWLNTPTKPLEASGTSGMKAAVNGALNFSVLDGWWIEAVEFAPLSGFSIGEYYSGVEQVDTYNQDADSLYNTLEKQVIPLYYGNKKEWINRMKHAITLGAYFNTQRVLEDYMKFLCI